MYHLSAFPTQDLPFSKNAAILNILRLDYSHEVIEILCSHSTADDKALEQKKIKSSAFLSARRKDEVDEGTSLKSAGHAAWPEAVPDETILGCLKDYHAASQWKPPPVCAVCSRSRSDLCYETINVTYENIAQYSRLRVSDKTLLRLSEDDEFKYGCPLLDGLLLERADLTDISDLNAVLICCSDCRNALQKGKMPKFALANNLYTGRLPAEFDDLTWIEEEVCSLYRSTAHIARLRNSSKASDPFVLAGNVCAHDMNIVSTATVLPRTSADINDHLTVVFLGAGKFNKQSMSKTSMFTVRKHRSGSFRGLIIFTSFQMMIHPSHLPSSRSLTSVSLE